MTRHNLSRFALILGGVLLAISFFLPLGYHSPREEWMATIDSLTSAESVGEGVVSGGMLVVIAYAYVWAVVVALAALWNFAGRRRAWTGVHVAIQSIGGLTLMTLCILLLSLHDPWLPAKFQWTGAILPLVMLVPVWATALLAAPARREWVVVAVGMVPQVLFQFMLVFVSLSRAGQAHGFVIGGLGAVLAFTGAIGSAVAARSGEAAA